MMRVLLSLFILGVSGEFMKPKTRNLKVKKEPTQRVTEKYQLSRKEGVWKSSCDVRGLALGGWFVPEKFINIKGFHTPDMPKNMSAPNAEGTLYEGEESVADLCQLSKRLGRQELDARMKRHLETFIQESDFDYIAKTGVNTLRIPVAYWNVIKDPYEIYAPLEPEDSLVHLDNAMKWAQKNDLAVILDLHASPGSQNGWEHSGCSGHIGMFQGQFARQNQKLNVEVVEKLAERYANHPALLGIEVINEPTGYHPEALTRLYKDSYDAIRRHDKEAWVIVYAHKADRAMGLAHYEFTNDPHKKTTFHNLVLDKHEYACFGDGRNGPPGETLVHHTKIVQTWKKELDLMNNMFPTILGEWSLCHGGGTALKLKDWNKIQQDAWRESTVGAVFWTYKTMTENARWSYRVTQEYVDVMADNARCEAEPQLAATIPGAKDFLRHGKHEHKDIGYEWEMEELQ